MFHDEKKYRNLIDNIGICYNFHANILLSLKFEMVSYVL
jgi:hypothetical protein